MTQPVKLIGFGELLEKMDKLSKSVSNRLARNALNQATGVVAKAAKQRVPKLSGALKKSIGKKVKTGRRKSGTFGVVGPRLGFKGMAKIGRGKRAKQVLRDPNRYSHLVEYGTVHSPAKPFMRPAWDAKKAEVNRIIRRVLTDGIEKEARKS